MSVNRLEILAPAGDPAALEAALQAGAGAVYFGLTVLNARRAARNFRQEELAEAVGSAHAHAARAYLTLNIDLAERELGQAARILELARQCGVDAVLVRDPALLALRVHYSELEFHFSTQTSMTNSADVAAAGRLGADRVVLARELSLAEIAAACGVGVRTEVFVQGAMCFSVSGRCLLSSWVGGRSGNRGTCTSPCRVPWSISSRPGGCPAGTPLSMHDLSAMGRLAELRRAGVTALKIEGRLKNADWVARAVRLYRDALQKAEESPPTAPDNILPATSEKSPPTASDNILPAASEKSPPTASDNILPATSEKSPPTASGGSSGLSTSDDLLPRAAQLGAYAGRAVTCDYLDGRRDQLTGESGRMAAALPVGETGETSACEAASADEACGDATGPGFDFSIQVESRGIVCSLQCGGRTVAWTLPKTVVRRANKAIPIERVIEILGAGPIQGFELRQAATNAPDFLMVPRAFNALMDRVAAAIRQARKAPAETVRIELPEAVQALMQKAGPHEANRRRLGDRPDRARLAARAVRAFLRRAQPEGILVEGLTAATLGRLLEAGTQGLVVALPQVFFEHDLPRIRRLIEACKAARLPVEVNSWGGWELARVAGVRLESGPGLPVLNSLAAKVLREAGIRTVTLSPEADRRQLEELTACCPVPCSLVVFGRPPLVTTRVELPEGSLGQVFEDRRGVRLRPASEQGLTVFRPVEPFDLRDVKNERIRVRHLVVDLVGSDDPAGDWHAAATDLRPVPGDRPFRFNYDRTLA
jgi:collagenase-like PrtC family protease